MKIVNSNLIYIKPVLPRVQHPDCKILASRYCSLNNLQVFGSKDVVSNRLLRLLGEFEQPNKWFWRVSIGAQHQYRQLPSPPTLRIICRGNAIQRSQRAVYRHQWQVNKYATQHCDTTHCTHTNTRRVFNKRKCFVPLIETRYCLHDRSIHLSLHFILF